MCEFTHLLATIQDALDEGLSDNVDFLVQENVKKQEIRKRSVVQSGNTGIPSNSIEPDDGYEVDRDKDHVKRTNIIW